MQAGWFLVAATGMVVLALLFVRPDLGRRTAAGGPGDPGAVPGRMTRRRTFGPLLVAVPMAAGLAYGWLGDPGALNPQRAALSAQLREADGPLDEATAGLVLVELQRHLQRQPDDARAWVLKARLDLRAQRFEQAAAGFDRALQGHAKTKSDAGVWVESAEALGLLQGGTLAGPPRERVNKALALNPDHGPALDLAGSAAWEAGEFTLAATHWKRLLASIPAGSPRHLQLSAAIQRAEQRARFELPVMR